MRPYLDNWCKQLVQIGSDIFRGENSLACVEKISQGMQGLAVQVRQDHHQETVLVLKLCQVFREVVENPGEFPDQTLMDADPVPP